RRDKADGPGVVVADVEVGRAAGPPHAPPGYWIQELDPVSKLGWRAQSWHGRRWYRRHVAP
ncbi:MAG TPA: hypothetical protein VIP46_22800, partial [Pyrinomonadaceae bacterium]